MAQTFLQRLLGIAPLDKAETGSGLFALQGFPMLSSLSNRPEKLIAECEMLFHRNVWVAACERAIVGRFASVEFHLEDDNDETVDSDTSPLAASLLQVLNRPSPRRTRRALWSITGRHMGLTGNAFWYLNQRELLGGTPLEVLYINPARMTPAEDGGGNLLGWIMDHPQNPLTPRGVQPTPFDMEEIIHFVLDEPDTGHYGIGVAETAQSKIELSRLTDKHASITMASGGRLAGIISPKAGGATISDDGWQAVIRDYRNIVSDPDSAKRVQVMRSPIDFTQTSADPSQIQLRDLMVGGRDDILAAWQVPQSQLGVIPARGLNSGETPKFEEAQLWQGPIQARLGPFLEKVQTELIDRWDALGLSVHIEAETPEFDDEAPLYDNAVKAAKVPLSIDQRLALVGKDPLDEALYGTLGAAIYMDQTLVRIDDGSATPSPTQPAPLPAVDTAQLAMPENMKASPLETLRHRVEVKWEPRIRAKVLEVFAAQRDEVSGRVFSKHAHLSRRPTDTATWWNSERERDRLRHALEPLVVTMAREVARLAEEKVPRALRPAKATVDAGYIDAVLSFLRRRVGERIDGITDTTRDELSALIQAGVSEGLGPAELSQRIQAATRWDEASAERIARTETMFAYNDAALGTYRELGAEMVQAIDGDQDDECASRDGREFTVAEAYDIQDHPNGTLDWIPIVPTGKAETVDMAPMLSTLKAAIEYGQRPEPGPPIVNVEPVVIPPAEVVVDTAPFAKALDELRETMVAALTPKPRKVTVLRDERGQIIGTEEA